ncbi:tetratricopeptide repeat-containing sensor histidine kinase [Puia sp.]|jgi:two-component sensor histidine kinase|uniref:tetratricopeptide repeat-containing sensor histidine kinase n=1 Tax=Puia sp. TaxID=2045100 RepID=UPI002F3EE17F
MERVVIIIICVLLGNIGVAQYYPAPKPVSPGEKSRLLSLLKNSRPGKNSAALLLDLSNLYLNLPLKRASDLDRAIRYADAAAALSTSIHDDSGYNAAQLLRAEILTGKDDMASAEEIAGVLNDTSKIKLWLMLSFKYWARSAGKSEDNRAKGLAFAGQARESAARLHRREDEILALRDIAMIHTDRGDSTAEQELLDVVKRYKAIGNPNLHYTYEQLAELHHDRGNPDKALYYSIQAIDCMNATGDTIVAGDLYFWRGMIYLNNDEYQKAIDYFSLAIAKIKIRPSRYDMAYRPVFSLIPWALRKMKKYPEAVDYMKNVIKEYPARNDVDRAADAAIIGNIYRDMKAYDQAEKYFLIASRIGQRQRRTDNDPYFDLGQLYVESGEYAKAKPYLQKSLDFMSGQMTSAKRRHMEYMLFLTDSATGDYLSAIKDLNRYRGWAEVQLEMEKDNQLRKLDIQYETKQKEAAIKLRDQNILTLNQSAKIREMRLSRSNEIKNITIGIVLLLLIITGLLYRQYRNKQKSSRVIAQQNDLITEKNQQLQQLIQQKEWLLKEVHHRVKNNLHTVICMLQAHTVYPEERAKIEIENSQHRIFSMSLIHEKLYQSEDIQTIDMGLLIPELVEHLRDSFGVPGRIQFDCRISPIHLNAAQAIPLALIINEALTNSIKYAFPANRNGVISVSLKEQDEEVVLEIADNGVGIEGWSEERKMGSMGLQLMGGLSKEMKGNFAIENKHGINIRITFKNDVIWLLK